MTMPGGDLDTVVQRLADDEAFAEQVRQNASIALYGYLLTNWDRDRIVKIANGIDPDAPELDENGEPIVPVVPEKPASRKRGAKKAAAPVPPAVVPEKPKLVATPLAAAEPLKPKVTPPPTVVLPVPEQAEDKRGLPLLWILGGAAVLVLVGLLVGGVFSGGGSKGTTSLSGDPTPFVTPSDTPSPTESPTPSPTPSPTDSPYPTAYPVETPTTQPPTVAPTTQAPTVAPATQAPSPTPSPQPKPTKSAAPMPDPVVGNPSASNGSIYESGCGTPTSSAISARVTDPAGISRVELTWFVNGVNSSGGPKTMRASGSTYSGTLGPFAKGTLGADSQPIDVTVTAIDNGGRQTSTTTQVQLSGC